MANPEGSPPTWKPRLVKMPVPTMLAMTMHVAVRSEIVFTPKKKVPAYAWAHDWSL